MARQTRAEARAQTILRKQIRSTKYQTASGPLKPWRDGLASVSTIPLSPASAVRGIARGGMTR